MQEEVQRLVTKEGKIVPKKCEVEAIIKMFQKDTIGEGARKLYHRISAVYAGIGRTAVQGVINQSEQHTKQKPLFSNKAPMRPIKSSAPMNLVEADLVDMRAYKIECEGSTYRYVLSVLDVFSR